MSCRIRWRVRGAAFLVLALVLFGVSFHVGARRAEAVGSLPGSVVLGTGTSVPYAGDVDGDGWDDMIIVDEANNALNINYAGSLGKFQSITAHTSGGALKGSNRFYFFTPLPQIASGAINTAEKGKIKYKSDLGIIYWNAADSTAYFHWKTDPGGWDSYGPGGTSGKAFPSGVNTSSFKAAIADLDGDGLGDPIIYIAGQGAVYALLSENDYSNAGPLYFYRNVGILDADLILAADYDAGKADPNDTTGEYYPRGRDYLDDIVFVKYGSYIKALRSVYGAASDQSGLTYYNYATAATIKLIHSGSDYPASGSPVFGVDWDGDGVKDVVWATLSGTAYTWSGYLSSANWGYSSNLLGGSNAWGTYRTNGIQEKLTVGHFDSADFKAEPAAVNNAPNGQGGGTQGSWYLPFSSNQEGGLVYGDWWRLPHLASWKYGLAEANWDDAAKTCYAQQTVANATPVPQAVDCAYPNDSQGFEVDGISEARALTYVRPTATVVGGSPTPTPETQMRINRLSPNLNYSNSLDPNANILYPGSWIAVSTVVPIATSIPTSGIRYPVYAASAPGAFNVAHSANLWPRRAAVGVDPETNCASPGPLCFARSHKLVPYADAQRGGVKTVIAGRQAMKDWLVVNRKGPMNDPRRWYIAKPGDEIAAHDTVPEADYVLLYRDWTLLMEEVRLDIEARYGRRVWPGIEIGAPNINFSIDPVTGSVTLNGLRMSGEYPDKGITGWTDMLTRVVARMTKSDDSPGPVDDAQDLSPDLCSYREAASSLNGCTPQAGADRLQAWTATDAAAFGRLYMYNSITVFPGAWGWTQGSLEQRVMDYDPAGGVVVPTPSVSLMDTAMANLASLTEQVAAAQKGIVACWNGTAFAVCNKPTFLTQMSVGFYNQAESGGVYVSCPQCSTSDEGRYGVLYTNAYMLKKFTAALEGKPSVWAWTYWGTIDQPLYRDDLNNNARWGSVYQFTEVLQDWYWDTSTTKKADSSTMLPTGYEYLRNAVSSSTGSATPTPMPTPASFSYRSNSVWGTNSYNCTSSDPDCYDPYSTDPGYGSVKTLPRPAWYP